MVNRMRKKIIIECDEHAAISVENYIKRSGFVTRIENVSHDSNVEKNREMLLQRSVLGLKKYGVGTDESPLKLREWLQHTLEEALDLVNYLQAAITKLDKGD